MEEPVNVSFPQSVWQVSVSQKIMYFVSLSLFAMWNFQNTKIKDWSFMQKNIKFYVVAIVYWLH